MHVTLNLAKTACFHDFYADLIISNPAALAGPHCAEALGVPHISLFTLPWGGTTKMFAHPLASLEVQLGAQTAANGEDMKRKVEALMPLSCCVLTVTAQVTN